MGTFNCYNIVIKQTSLTCYNNLKGDKTMKHMIKCLVVILLVACTPVSSEPLSEVEISSDHNIFRITLQSEIHDSLWDFADKVDLLSVNENSVYSPMSLYSALSMLLVATSGQSKDQLLEFLNLKDTSGLADLFRMHNYQDDDQTILNINSVWLHNAVTNFDESIIDELKDDYLTSSHSIDFSNSDAAGKEISEYISQQTNGFLTPRFTPREDTEVMLLNTLYFAMNWNPHFYKTQSINFKDVGLVDAVKTTMETSQYYENETEQAVIKHYQGQGSMIFIRPKNGLNLIEPKRQILDHLLDSEQLYEVSLIMPEIEVESTYDDLKDTLFELGLDKVLTDDISQSEISFYEDSFKTKNIISSIVQGAKIKVDKEGTTAGAYTAIEAPTSGSPQELVKAEMVLDVPYQLIVLGPQNTPLFVVNVINPTQ